MSLSSDLTHGDVTRILQIIDQLSDVEVRLEVEGMKLHVRKYGAGATGAPGIAMGQLEASSVASPPAPDAPLPARIAAPAAVEQAAPAAVRPAVAAPSRGA